MALSSAAIIANTSSTPATARLNNSSGLPNYSTEAVLAAANHHIGLSLNFPRSISSPLVCTYRAASQQSQQFVEENHRKHAPAIDGADRVKPLSRPTSFTSTGPDPLAPFWNTHKEGFLQPKEAASSSITSSLLTAELQLLANAASDRAEMHSILAQQRDNWNKLFQRMLTSASMTACVLSVLDGHIAGHSMGGLSLPALLLNAGTAAMMAVINQFQPSQLAEEQRTASRLFRKLANDIHYALHLSPHLRQSTSLLVDDCKRRLQALDRAFPMPLTPGGLEKFPTKVVPPVLIEPKLNMAQGDHQDNSNVVDCLDLHEYNGWDRQLAQELKHIAAMLQHSDIPKYTGLAQNLVKVNKPLAIAAPCFSASAALLNAAAMCTTPLPTNNIQLGMWAATFSVLATFLCSFSNDMQLGMVFELYRNSAGYYADVKTTIEETLRTPVDQRENGTLFRQRIAYQLGRWPTSQAEPVVPADAKEAGTLF
ncbi:hypothetical protein GOP47_0019241 [Adiantum capillus-veneris]|uniref:Uncharacterized protein n=1 Tax=Adiantum capillus-veneris TaxID=13818 RepID=A0A9D4UF85_ADICA|nr:hypothetical protein GOP47_0019241 [Adiantum capillus-veneris]